MQEKVNIAVFVDYDNIEIGVRSTLRRDFDVSLPLDALKERGDIVAKFAYANWGRQEPATRQMAENAVQMVQRIPSPRGDKNGADINLALDALEMAFTHEHVNAFAIVSGDSDFIPLVNKLKENDKRVIGCGVKSSTSELLVSSCDEFLYYDDLVRTEARTKRASATRAVAARRATKKPAAKIDEPVVEEPPVSEAVEAEPPKRGRRTKTAKKATSGGRRTKKKTAESEAIAEPEPVTLEPALDAKAEGLDKLVGIVTSLSQDYDPVWGSLVKQTLRRVHPDFREEHYGYGGFVEMLKDAEARSLVTLEYDQARGNYKIRVRA